MKLFKKANGAVSIFLVIILVPMLTISALFVDASKVHLSNAVAITASDLTLNTALTNYDVMLKDMYGLFATAQDTDELFSKLEDYYRMCITSSGVAEEDADSFADQIMAQLGMVAEDSKTHDMLNMELMDFTIEKRSDATMANPTVLKRGIIEFMKYRAPISTGLSFLSSLKSFTTLSKQTELVEKRQEYYQEEENVLKSAKTAWDSIRRYEEKSISKEKLSSIKTDYTNSQTDYERFAKTIIKDLYDETEKYVEVEMMFCGIEEREVEFRNKTRMIPIFYSDEEKKDIMTPFTHYKKYSDNGKATAENIKTALEEYHKAQDEYVVAKNNLLLYNGETTYKLQYLVQSNRQETHKQWIDAMEELYTKYSEMRHAVMYNGDTEDGVSVMETKGTLFGSTTEKTYDTYYDEMIKSYKRHYEAFNERIKQENLKLHSASSSLRKNGLTEKKTIEKWREELNTQMGQVYREITDYRQAIEEADKALAQAVTSLREVLEGVKEGGKLDTAEKEWKKSAENEDIKETSMAKQDTAEIKDLSKYLNPTDVGKLITRLENIQKNLNNMLTQMDSYTFFGTKISEIQMDKELEYILKNAIGDDALKHVPIKTTELDNTVDEWCKDKYAIGKPIDISWMDNAESDVNLVGAHKLRFYDYLEFRFGDSVFEETSETEGAANNPKKIYKNIQSTSQKEANEQASSQAEGENNEKNISQQPAIPSKEENHTTSGESMPNGTVDTDSGSVAKNSKKDLSNMFSNLGNALKKMGNDLLDHLSVAEYIMGMFSYDTIEKEYMKTHDISDVKDVNLKSHTLTPINKDNNFAYRSEVEYIIYGGKNEDNLKKAYGSIYAIRFGFNIIYAFTDGEIRDGALSLSLPISAATLGVIPAPLIQAAIIIGITCCEAGLDLKELRDGEKLPLFKTKETWRMSFSGLVNLAKGKVQETLIDASKNLIDEGTKKITELLDMTSDELDNVIAGGTDDILDYAGNALDTLIERHANTAIQKMTSVINTALSDRDFKALETIEKRADHIKGKLDTWLTDECSGEDIASIVKREAVQLIKEKYLSDVLEKMEGICNTDNIQNKVEDTISAMGDELQEMLENIRRDVGIEIVKASDEIVKYKKEFEKKVKDSLNEGADNLKETLTNEIGGIFGGGTTTLPGGGGDQDATGMASLLAFSYSDYLRLFVIIGLYANEENIFLRTADVIQLNMEQRLGVEAYRLRDAAAYVELEVEIRVKPLLIGLPLFADVVRDPVTNIGWYTFSLYDIRGY